jgi:hypothetical protein
MQVIDECSTHSEEVWKLCRPPVSLSSLRYCTHFANSTWAASIVCEVANSDFALGLCANDLALKTALLKALPTAWPVCGTLGPPSEADFAFERPLLTVLPKALGWCEATSGMEEIRSLARFVEQSNGSFDVAANLKRLQDANPSEQVLIAQEVRRAAFCGKGSTEPFQESFGNPGWRMAVLIGAPAPVVELVCTAGIELQFHDPRPEWPHFFPHFAAIACDEVTCSDERKALLFAVTLVASLAAEGTSAIARLLLGAHRHAFKDLVTLWRQRIEKLTPVAAPWAAAKLRGLKAELYV